MAITQVWQDPGLTMAAIDETRGEMRAVELGRFAVRSYESAVMSRYSPVGFKEVTDRQDAMRRTV